MFPKILAAWSLVMAVLSLRALTPMSTPVNRQLLRLLSTMETITAKRTVADRLREAIDESRWKDLPVARQAAALGVSRSLLHQWLDGSKRPTYERVAEPCARLGISPDWLLMGKEPKRTHALAEQDAQYEVQSSSEVGKMNLQQQKAALTQLIEDIPQAERMRVLYGLAKEAFEKNWIDQVPDAIMAAWSASEKIKKLKKRSPGTQ